jgi:riboflavin kinase/FMN adenylyltransferase
LRLDAFLLDHEGSDLYGQTMCVEFIECLRDERRSESVDLLMEQIHSDIARAREVAGRPLD